MFIIEWVFIFEESVLEDANNPGPLFCNLFHVGPSMPPLEDRLMCIAAFNLKTTIMARVKRICAMLYCRVLLKVLIPCQGLYDIFGKDRIPVAEYRSG